MMTPEQFKDVRKKLGITIKEMAENLKVNPRTVNRWENGDRKIPGPVEVALDYILMMQASKDMNIHL